MVKQFSQVLDPSPRMTLQREWSLALLAYCSPSTADPPLKGQPAPAQTGPSGDTPTTLQNAQTHQDL